MNAKTRTSNPKCPTCKKTVKNDDMTAICCEKCGNWYHGILVSLKIDEVKWLGASRNCESNDNIHRDRDDSMKLIVTGIPESGDSTNSRFENDFTELNGILNHIGFKADGNVVSFRRLGKSMSQCGERRKCRRLLITCESPHFLSRCFARCFKLQNNKHPVYLKKFLSSSEREIEKKILQKL